LSLLQASIPLKALSVYIENFKKAVAFFARSELLDFVNSKKKYDKKPIIRFHNSDYMKPVKEKDKSFDLLISQYAGFVSKHCKNYLKVGGLLLVNNSHGDASMAYLDDNFEFIGVFYKSKIKFYLTTKNLNKYFIPKKDIEITAEYLEKIQRGIGYTKTGSHYLFEKVE